MPEIEEIEPLIAVVDFHHARGPEIELWVGVAEDVDPAADNDWSLLPFMALTDGAHASTEDFSYFTLTQTATSSRPATSLFGISCTRQLDANKLKHRSADITRSTVQKAVVIIISQPYRFSQLRESLSAVTAAWFAQEDFSDVEILKRFQESLSHNLHNLHIEEQDQNQYIGLSLREMIHDFKHQTLVLFKCCLLQPKMLFFGSRCERLCMMQFALISLIPGLICNLQDCADPALDQYSQNISKATSLKTSERRSLLAYMGLPLQIFGKGSFFGPYTPLQQLDILADYGTKSYIVGSTNSLLLQQKDKYSDILVNLDEKMVNITSTSLRTALSLPAADRRWIDFLTQTVQDTWDPANPDRPHTMGYAGSEEFIRLQFEEYLLALLSSVSYHNHLSSLRTTVQLQSSTHTPEEDPSLEFNSDFIHAWKETSNYALFTSLTSESSLFDIIEAKHPTAGGLSVEDVQRRLAQQVAELHLDERVREGRETLGKHLAMGRERFGQLGNKIWADIEAMREGQRTRASEESSTSAHARQSDGAGSEGEGGKISGSGRYAWPSRAQAPDLTQVQASAKDASAKAGAYLSSWGSWARDKGKEWQEKRTTSPAAQSPPKTPINNTTSAAQHENSQSILSSTGSQHSGKGRLSGELVADKARRWSSRLKKPEKGSSSTADSVDPTELSSESAKSPKNTSTEC
ncbi:hypothetical protein EPUS_05912 [Endocarpon pusillum Z07020]|uniref:UDENN domain-containing protein n=1 Tax=Endocarpon pusillum (strain Z07020 / HMAS-L-300199) TaxID=1263415 RepID=U1HTI1_ENDPU|nr:uncharacterized protein EPUS_05912 [Endocarpon pusillum Z07020]ERF73900.1 hypothetical protein EPUS_05912 [Endocarpon pusillum Z07020]